MFTFTFRSIDYFYDILEDWDEAYDIILKTFFNKCF